MSRKKVAGNWILNISKKKKNLKSDNFNFYATPNFRISKHRGRDVGLNPYTQLMIWIFKLAQMTSFGLLLPWYSKKNISSLHANSHTTTPNSSCCSTSKLTRKQPYPYNPTPHEHHLHTPHHTPDKNSSNDSHLELHTYTHQDTASHLSNPYLHRHLYPF